MHQHTPPLFFVIHHTHHIVRNFKTCSAGCWKSGGVFRLFTDGRHHALRQHWLQKLINSDDVTTRTHLSHLIPKRALIIYHGSNASVAQAAQKRLSYSGTCVQFQEV